MLPRLLYLGDVPVESSYHGSTLLFRLLQRYPVDQLRIIEGNLIPPRTGRRLPGVTYTRLRVGHPRLLNSRLHRPYSQWLQAGAAGRARRVPGLAPGFSAQAVLTVAHGYSWVTAARFARAARLPLHLIVHDDWPRVVMPALQQRADREFAEVYRAAASRFCTSPHMADDYQRRYGVSGTVLLPYRGPDTLPFPVRTDRRADPDSPLVFAFAGSINSPGYATLLRQLADAIASHAGTLLIFGPVTPEQAAGAGLDRPNIRLGGLLAADELAIRLREQADVLFVPMSFAPEDAANMRMGFPSKLTDYTMVGLPLLICGPPYCSAVAWAQQNPGVAEVVTSTEPEALERALAPLWHDPTYRRRLAETAQRIGDRDFSWSAAQAQFQSALAGALG